MLTAFETATRLNRSPSSARGGWCRTTRETADGSAIVSARTRISPAWRSICRTAACRSSSCGAIGRGSSRVMHGAARSKKSAPPSKGSSVTPAATRSTRARSVVTHHIEIASAPNYVGIDLVRTFSMSGNRLTLRTPQRQLAGQTSSSTLVWERDRLDRDQSPDRGAGAACGEQLNPQLGAIAQEHAAERRQREAAARNRQYNSSTVPSSVVAGAWRRPASMIALAMSRSGSRSSSKY